VVLAAVLFPPAGLVLLFLRKSSLGSKLFGAAAILIVGIVELFAIYGLHVELDGTGMRPIFSFYKPERHYTAIERDRSRPDPAPSTPEATTRTPETFVRDAPSRSAPAPYWTDFRGPRRDGIYDEMPVVSAWPAAGLPRLWKQPVGGGYASFVVADGKAYTIEQRRDQEVVAAYDVETGRELWTNSWKALFQEAMGGDGPRATPTWHEGRLYALGANGELRCLDAGTGKVIWAKNILEDNGAQNLQWGMANAPLIVDQMVVVLPGGPAKSVVAYHKLTGAPVWKALEDKQAYTSPLLVTLAGRRQILVVSATRAMGLTLEGKLLWDYPWQTQYDINSAQPIIVSDNRFFISAGYGHGAALVEVTGSGDRYQARTVWQNTRMKNKFNSSVLHQGHVYGLDEAILACIDVETGELKWKGGRYGYGQILLAGSNIIVLTESGELVLVKATPESHQELSRFEAISGKTWNVPAIAGGRLLVRNETEMACFRIAP
jgi:outer membrane protein assembly factor BamB